MPGILIALEGIDGSGKGTQAALLNEHLKQAGVRTKLLSFPRYQETAFGREIGRFLNGEFGGLDQVHPLLASLLFAGDRYESRDLIFSALAEHDVVICDRYVASNIAHQAAKRTGDERRQLIDWIERLEFDIYQLPQPQLTIWLDVPVAMAQELIARKTKRSYTDQKADLQEADGNYLQRVADVYADLAKSQPGWHRIACVTDGKLRVVDNIAADVFSLIPSPLESRL